jgi:tellurite resistance protein
MIFETSGQQAMILQSTTFPFDKIEPITRHSELPDDARNQLDEVEKYMKSEMQVCDFLTKNKMVSKAEQIQRVKKDTESMTKVGCAVAFSAGVGHCLY